MEKTEEMVKAPNDDVVLLNCSGHIDEGVRRPSRVWYPFGLHSDYDILDIVDLAKAVPGKISGPSPPQLILGGIAADS